MCADSYTQTNPLERKSQRTTSLQLEPAKTFAQLRIITRSDFSQYLFENVYAWVVYDFKGQGNGACHFRNVMDNYQVVSLV